MASTKTVNDVINWAAPFVGWLPLSPGTNSEPAVTSANIILQTILAPPFKWRWNRSTVTFTTTAPTNGVGVQDYSTAVANFGFIEKASIAIAGSDTKEIGVSEEPLGDDTVQSRPEKIAVQLNDGTGNITFRLMPVPDQAYTVTVTFQKAAPAIPALTSTFAPIPDYLAVIYQWGFLSLMLEYQDADKAAVIRQLFVASLVSRAEGLSEADKNLFLQSWLGTLRQTADAQTMQQLGARGRGINP